MSLVPNTQPTVAPSTYRIAFVGEAPGADEEQVGKPFVGMSGRFLDNMLSLVNISRACCFIGNVMQVRPPLKGTKQLSPLDKWGDREPERAQALQAGLDALRNDLTQFRPHLVVCLGKTALWAAYGLGSLDDWRGSLLLSDKLTGTPLKCLATYHPAAALHNYSLTPLIMFDLKRAAREAHFPELRLPQRNLRTNLTYEETIQALQEIFQTKPPVACDIEGGVNCVSCISFATSPTEAFIVPFESLDGHAAWAFDEELQIWRRVASIMADPGIPKTWQNGLYDRFVLQYSYGIVVRGSTDDTMLKHWELYCELEKSLAVQASIYTDQPFYKFERKTTDQPTFYRYCCTDSCVTYEISSKLTPCLSPAQLDHYGFNLEVLNPLLYMELRGLRYNTRLAAERLTAMQGLVYTYQARLDAQAGSLGTIKGINFEGSSADVLGQVQAAICWKRQPEKPKKESESDYQRIREILSQCGPESLGLEDKGFINVACGATMNTKSSKKFQDFLYKTCGLPVQWKLDPATKEMRPTTDYEALLKLSKSHKHPVLVNALELSRLRTREQMLRLVSINGRVHASYNLVGSETGRVTTSKSSIFDTDARRVGMNMQTVPDDWEIGDDNHPLSQGMRDLFLADEDCYLIKCDLKGSDGWTIGACMAALGDSTMLDDLKAKIKPAQVAAYILIHGIDAYQKIAKDRVALRETTKSITSDMWQYFVSKQVIWGSAYTMGPRKAGERVFIESDGKVNLSESQTKEFQAAIYVRYRFKIWHNHMQRFLEAQNYPARISASNGFTRRFFGRRNEILGEALAHLPQVVTTWATLKAVNRLWSDPENRTNSTYGCKLRLEPLHQVHDELVMQCKQKDKDWAINKIREYFNNPIEVSGQQITIPFGGFIGTSWAMDERTVIQEFE